MTASASTNFPLIFMYRRAQPLNRTHNSHNGSDDDDDEGD